MDSKGVVAVTAAAKLDILPEVVLHLAQTTVLHEEVVEALVEATTVSRITEQLLATNVVVQTTMRGIVKRRL